MCSLSPVLYPSKMPGQSKGYVHGGHGFQCEDCVVPAGLKELGKQEKGSKNEMKYYLTRAHPAVTLMLLALFYKLEILWKYHSVF